MVPLSKGLLRGRRAAVGSSVGGFDWRWDGRVRINRSGGQPVEAISRKTGVRRKKNRSFPRWVRNPRLLPYLLHRQGVDEISYTRRRTVGADVRARRVSATTLLAMTSR